MRTEDSGHIGSKGEELSFSDKLETLFDGTVHSGETEPPTRRRRLSDGSTSSLLHTKDPVNANPDYRTGRLNDSRTTQSSLGKLNYSIGECIECLDGMEEIEQGRDLYLFALDIFLKKGYTEVSLN
ncbi:hypothetical protein Acr_24g0011550 [Actinidia rufa]|uniref:Uncharacterized protein n=1 Tax=Actinidia rufa TaxID=165716 RepID=A0A7J0GVT4_9ERIC|nr:hypothetical protein Acr_24g0011550 [Actinidia rufa]